MRAPWTLANRTAFLAARNDKVEPSIGTRMCLNMLGPLLLERCCDDVRCRGAAKLRRAAIAYYAAASCCQASLGGNCDRGFFARLPLFASARTEADPRCGAALAAMPAAGSITPRKASASTISMLL